MASRAGKHILLTGPPGIGKTTLVQSVCHSLQEKGIQTGGFYTEEIRQGPGRGRTGFDVVTLDGKRAPLARLNGEQGMPVVGRYKVDIGSFERTVLPVMSSKNAVIVLDEIGKMELLSHSFCTAVRKVFEQEGVIILATVPISKGKPLQLVDEIKIRSDCILYEVTIGNRDSLNSEITKHINKCIT